MSNAMNIVDEAIKTRSAISFSYTDTAGEESFRTVILEDTISTYGSNLLVVGIDVDKKDYRRFYVDQMDNVRFA